MVNFQWSINKLLKDANDIVKVVFFSVTGTDSDSGVSKTMELQMPLNEPESELVPFDLLDEQTVIDWVVEKDADGVVTIMLAEIEQAKLDVIEGASLPWS